MKVGPRSAALPTWGELLVIFLGAAGTAHTAKLVSGAAHVVPWWLEVGLAGGVALLTVAPFAIATGVGMAGVARAAALGAAAALGFLWVTLDARWHALFGARFDADAVELAWASVAHDEIGEGQADRVLASTGRFVAAAVAALVALRVFVPSRWRALRPTGRRAVLALLATAGVYGTAVVAAAHTAPAEGPGAFALTAWALDDGVDERLPAVPRADWDASREAWVACLARRYGELERAKLTATTRPDIYVFHVEGLRFDASSADLMPRLSALAAKGLTRLPAHFSTGTQTGSGTYGLISGTPSYLYTEARRQGLLPLPLLVLQRLGYELSIRTASALKYDRLRDWFTPTARFVRKRAKGRDFPAAESALLRRLAKDVRATAASPNRVPRFEYLYVYSTHYDYYYPPKFERFTPVVPLGFDLASGRARGMRRTQDALHNRYRNAVLFADTLIGGFLEQLIAAGRWDDSVVIIAGDHGEEFWEMGRFGHTFGLNRYQTQVSALVHLPGAPLAFPAPTSHADLFPTVLDRMGVSPPVADWVGGRPLGRPATGAEAVTISEGRLGTTPARRHVWVDGEAKVEVRDRRMLRVVGATDHADRDLPVTDATLEAHRERVTALLAAPRAGLARCEAGR